MIDRQTLLALAKEANFEVAGNNEVLSLSQDERITLRLERFAQLIAGRCADVCKKLGDDYKAGEGKTWPEHYFEDVTGSCAGAIREHFGVPDEAQDPDLTGPLLGNGP